MNTTMNAGTPGQSAASPEVANLRRTLNEIDGYSQAGFGSINAIAKLTLLAMEAPEAYRFPELFACALEVIRDIAQDTENTINAEAEEFGCNAKDTPARRRSDARREFNKTGGTA